MMPLTEEYNTAWQKKTPKHYKNYVCVPRVYNTMEQGRFVFPFCKNHEGIQKQSECF